jgi:hypothetical protein
MGEFEITDTFGWSPLQQYLIPMPGGRRQALGIAWDARPATVGGQRWFHLYPDEKVTHDDVLHWTKPSQSWNDRCARCHATDLHKGYRADGDRYETTAVEMRVSCEACHGPGSAHVAWARGGKPTSDATKGLRVRFDDDRATWTFTATRRSRSGRRRGRRTWRSRRARPAMRVAASWATPPRRARRSWTATVPRSSTKASTSPTDRSMTRCTSGARSSRARCTARA